MTSGNGTTHVPFDDADHAARVFACVDDEVYYRHRAETAAAFEIDPDQLDSMRESVRAADREDAARQAAADAMFKANGAEHRPHHADVWPDPFPLPGGLPDVDPFDLELLPPTLRPWAGDIADRMQCPPDFVAVTIMVALCAIVGRKVGMRPQAKTDWTVVCNAWAMLIGRPGVLKSPAMEAALAPIKRLSAKAADIHERLMGDWKADATAAKLKADAINKAAAKALVKDPSADIKHLLANEETPEPPPLRRYVVNDTTAAALGELLRHNDNGLLVYRDELVSLLRSLDREENAEARGFYLTGWNGDSPYTIDRIGRGMNLHIPAVCITLLGSTQPGRVADYIATAIRGGMGDDGLLQRFGLMVWPDVAGDWKNVDRDPDWQAKREAFAVFEYLDTVDWRELGAERDRDHTGEPDGQPFLRFDPEALACFTDWRENLEHELRGGTFHPAMESHFAKYRKLVPALALVLHLAGRGVGPVPVDPTMLAIRWAAYLQSHARRVYASITMADVTAAKAIVQRIRKGDLPQQFGSRDVWRPGWSHLTDRQQVADALLLLVDHHWLKSEKKETAGRPAIVYTVNPKAMTS